MTKRFLSTLVAALILMQFYVLLAETWWGFELFTHYIHYYVLAGLVLLPILLWKRMFIGMLFVSIILSMQLGALSPYLIKNKTPQPGELKIMSSNFYAYNDNYEALYEVIQAEDPDIFLIVEANIKWRAEKNRYLEGYPYWGMTNTVGPFGMALFSKQELVLRELKMGRFPILEAILQTKNGPLRIIGFHPIPPSTSEFAANRNKAIADLSTHLSQNPMQTIVMGDFNSSPWSPYFKDLLKKTNLKEARLGFGLTPTWNEDLWFLSTPIDHILVSPEIEVTDFHLGADTGSDHLPVLAEITLQ